jgi:hypothetical protein
VALNFVVVASTALPSPTHSCRLTKINEEGARNVSLFERQTELQVEELEFLIEIQRWVTS